MDTLNQLSKYNHWANDRIFKNFEQHGNAIPASCLRLLSHIVNTHYIWLSRITGEKQPVGVWEDHDPETCKKLDAQASALYEKIMAENGKDLSRVISYTNTQGLPYKNTINDILLHAFNHATYHRAQIAWELRKSGLEPTSTDYIVFVR